MTKQQIEDRLKRLKEKYHRLHRTNRYDEALYRGQLTILYEWLHDGEDMKEFFVDWLGRED